MWMVTKGNLHKMFQLWKAKGKLESLQVIDQCHAAMLVLHGVDKLCGFNSNAKEDIELLALYISDKWLTGAHANLLQRDLQHIGKSHFDPVSSYFYAKISLGLQDIEKYSTTDPLLAY